MGEFQTIALTEPSDSPFSELEYVGWIPTANGRLSFRHIGDATHPFVCKYTNFVASDRTRYVAGFQRRNLSDLLFSAFTTRRSGNFWFAIACNSIRETEQGELRLDALEGEIGIFKSKKDWKEFEGKTKPAQLIVEMNKLRLRGPSSEAVDQHMCFRQAVLDACDISIRFKLMRNGEVYLTDPTFRDQTLKTRSVGYSENNIGVPFLKWVSDQSYFFLRDLCHLHQHHSPFEDTILILQDRENKNRN